LLPVVAVLLAWAAPAWVRILARTCALSAIWAPTVFVSRPEAIVAALESSGPVFIKLAQWLSTRRDLLSAELCDGMAQLHERVSLPHMSADVLDAQRAVPGLEVGALLGGGSVAQVFRGTLSQGEGRQPLHVAIKVRRRGVDDLLDTDLLLLRWAARTVELLRPRLRWLAMEDAVETFREFLLQQVNLDIEAANLRRLGENFRGVQAVRVPEVYYSDECVLVTSVAEGVSLSEFIRLGRPRKVREAVFEALTDLMARMLLRDHFVHGDLHPGNAFIHVPESPGLFVQPVVTLIDAGICIEMSPSLQEMARASMLAALNRDGPTLGEAVVKLHREEGHCSHARDVDVLAEDVGYLMLAGCFMSPEDVWSRHFSTYKEYRASRVSEYFWRMLDLLSKHRVRVSPSLWTVMTAFALIEGSVQELGFGVNVLRSAAPYIFSAWDFFGRWRLSHQADESEREHREGA